MRRAAPALLLAALWAHAAGAPETRAQTLEEALALAYRTSPSLYAARARLAATREDIEQARASVLPRLDLSTNAYTWEDVKRGPGDPDTDRSLAFNGFAVRQSLRFGLDSFLAIPIAESVAKAEETRLLSAEQDALLGAATAYADVIRDLAVLDLNVGNERVHERELEATRDRFQVGEVTRTDVSQAESRLARARADRISAEGQLAEARAAYESAVGRPPGTLTQPRPLAGLPADLDEALARTRGGSPAVVRGRALVDAARRRARQLDRSGWPSVSLSGEYSYDDEHQGRSHRGRALVTLDLSMPLYTSGAVQSRQRQALHALAQTREDTRRTLQTALQGTTSVWQRLQVAHAQIAAFTAAVTASEIALAGVKEEEAVGSRTVLDVLDAEQELLDASVRLLRARRDEVVGTYQLRRAVGTLTMQGLGLAAD